MDDSGDVTIDVDYEFSAPKFFDFIEGETEEEMRQAQLWFDTALTHAPSPYMHKIKKTTRTVQLDSLCDFTQTETSHDVPSEAPNASSSMNNIIVEPEKQSEKTEHDPADKKEDVTSKDELKKDVSSSKNVSVVEKTEELKKDVSSSNLTTEQSKTSNTTYPSQGAEVCTPKPQMASQKNKNTLQTESKKQQTARRIASAVKNPSLLKSQTKSKTPAAAVKRDTNKVGGTPNLAQENQAIKRQKLEGGKTRQILNIKTQILPHKARPGFVNGGNATTPAAKSRIEERKMYVREQAPVPFVSMAEMMQKFQSGTRDLHLPPRPSSSLSQQGDHSQVMQTKPKLKLTRPKEPSFETSQRVRSVKLKSSAEIEEEMMAKIPKFKARPVNRKILEAPTLPAMKRSTPQMPEFQEFHLETMERANQNAETSTVASTEAAPRVHQWRPHLTTPKTPPLQTLLRARAPNVKSTEELEREELEKAPKFKARPLNKKIFESKGELGLFCNKKRQVTIPEEFHFAIDERIPPPTANVADMFDKLSLCSDTHTRKPIPRITAPNPFHLHTEERGAEKEKKFVMEVIHKQIEEERARIPKATPYPYTTDYPVVPPKPEPKQCTKPAPFQLESVARHEEEMQREMEERRRLEEEEARMRMFKAQPVLKEDPIPVPEKVRIPLTEVQEFDLHVEHRAADRAEFDKKVKEKEMMYKRYRDEAESAKMMEEEKALKQLRRTLVPHARPVPNFSKPFLPRKSSKGVTKPKSPRLKIIERTERRKMVVTAATSSAASNMR
ncbi:putative TPX2 central domain-containing protein [Helianthus annuus]|uniref:Putative targeting protein for XKLP2 n=1 Tax=Helianthus annuus TaxID=4232 RepID=A0A251RQI4_HELAN|nr:protein TPX2 isoform X1 [Helianthus annuus]KAF5756076.1 putative TPX2 central domain-containing protein [Helianthus annuus]KAJ0434253.1 putative TPX2 central domain-containing protein [Helianthus annuus]